MSGTGAMEEPAAKIAATDPRVRLPSGPGRTLRKGPALALALGMAAVTALAVALALRPPPADLHRDGPESDPTAAVEPPTIPESLRGGPADEGELRTRADRAQRGGRVDVGSRGLGSAAGSAQALAQDARAGQALWAEQDRRAAAAGVLFEGAVGGEESSPLGRAANPAGATSLPGELAAPALAASVGRLLPAAGEGDPNLQGRKNAFLEGTAETRDPVLGSIEAPRSPYELEAGTIVPAVLVTGINSDLPGPVVAQVRESVYDSVTGNWLLIPQGSRLLANYDSMVVWGQERVLVCWSRLIFPNGNSMQLGCMPAADLGGGAGLADEVDEHWWKIVQGASVAALLSATTVIGAGNTAGYNPTVAQVMARNGADSVNQAGQRITQRNLEIQPTITVRPGFSVNVILTRDLVIPPYVDAVGEGGG